MKFQAKTEEQIQEEMLLAEGTYDFEVLKGKDTVSSNGNDVINLMLKIFDQKGNEHIIWDALVNTPKMAYKIRHAASACKIMSKYESGELLGGDFEGSAGQCIVQIQKESRNKDTGKIYPTKNVIKDYIKRDNEKEDKLNDEIPF